MLSWFEGMTAEDHERNMEEFRKQRKRDAEALRARARWMMNRADEIDPIQREVD